MNVTVGQTVEADTACDTTVTATITAVIGAPAAEIPEPSTQTVTQPQVMALAALMGR